MTKTAKNEFWEPMSESALFAWTQLSANVVSSISLMFSFPDSSNTFVVGLGWLDYVYGWVKINFDWQ